MFDRHQKPPSVLGLFGDAAKRRAVWRYWVRDTLMGTLNLSMSSLLRRLPTDWGSSFAAAHARLTRSRYKDSDARARRLWNALRPNESADDAMRTLWRNACRTMAEYSRLDKFWQEGRIAVTGLEHLERARAAGRPIIIAGMHLGNWETLALTLVKSGYPVSGTYLPPENRFDHHIATAARLRYGAKLVYPNKHGGRAAYRALMEAGDVFLFYIDELFEDRVSAPAFGRARHISGNIANAVRLARLTNADIFLMHCERINDSARFRVTITPPAALVRTADTRADLAANVDTLDRMLDPIVRGRLDQWFYALDFEFEPKTEPKTEPETEPKTS